MTTRRKSAKQATTPARKHRLPAAPKARPQSSPLAPGEEAFRPPVEEFDYAAEPQALGIDRLTRASMARATAGISPVSIFLAWTDWAQNFAVSPGKQGQLWQHALSEVVSFAQLVMQSAGGDSSTPVLHPQPGDKRFESESWQSPPFNLYRQAFLQTERWWHNAMTGVAGVSRRHERLVDFMARQMIDVWSPGNFVASNPDLLEDTRAEGGANLWRGAQNWLSDVRDQLDGTADRSDVFVPGCDVAVTPGRVVYRNHLIELIQYDPQSDKVRPEPVLVVPAWIMKYYILDLSPHNSYIDYLVKHGHTVFAISWRNPGSDDSELGMDDYRRLGPMAALDAIEAIVPGRKVHALGYCLGGTLMAITAAAMAQDGDDRLATLTMLAAQVDFTDAGELTMFIDPNGLAYLEDLMWSQGYLDAKQMAGAFTLLRSNDLFWSRLIHEYLYGRREDKNDLMSWSADATRMPFRMHSQYLRELFLENRLTQGKYEVDGRPVALTDIAVPIFAVGAAKDHIAPWQSVYKIRLFADTDVTFLLTSGGHNAGIVTPPGHPRRIYQVDHACDRESYVDPDRWRLGTPVRKGSWWPEYRRWLGAHSGAPVDPPPTGCAKRGYPALDAAPGTYVLMR